MTGIINKDSSFFKITSNNVSLEGVDLSKDLLSLSITERIGAMPQGSLKFYDKNNLYSRIFRTGAQLSLAWGYKNFGTEIGDLSSNLFLDEFTGNIERRGLEGFVSSPSGGGDVKGVITYSCNFTSYGFRGEDKTKIFSSGVKRDVVFATMADIGILPINMIISFTGQSDKLSYTNSIRQDETAYAFLSRLSREWKTLFSIGYNNKGLPVGYFVDPNKIDKLGIVENLMGVVGRAHNLGYLGKINNIKSYTWTSNESENGVGQDVRLELIDGQPVFRRYVAQEEKVISYRLNTDKIKEVFKDKESDGVLAQTNLIKEMLSVNDFEQIKHFFDPYESTTAPQGFGYKIKLNMVGNPLFSPPNQVRLLNGFPDRLGNKDTIYYINEVVHTIDKSGYNMTVEIVDVFSFSDIGQGLL